jgi:hypothetical protein
VAVPIGVGTVGPNGTGASVDDLYDGAQGPAPIARNSLYYDWKDRWRATWAAGGDESAACRVNTTRSLGRYVSHVSAATKIIGGRSDTTKESQRRIAVSQEVSCRGRTLLAAALGFTAGGSGSVSSAAITSSAPRIQIVHEIDFIWDCAPEVIVTDLQAIGAHPFCLTNTEPFLMIHIVPKTYLYLYVGCGASGPRGL